MAPIDPRDFGRLEAEVRQLCQKMDHLSKNVDFLIGVMNQGKGSWRVVVIASGIIGWFTATITALAIKLLTVWPFK